MWVPYSIGFFEGFYLVLGGLFGDIWLWKLEPAIMKISNCLPGASEFLILGNIFATHHRWKVCFVFAPNNGEENRNENVLDVSRSTELLYWWGHGEFSTNFSFFFLVFTPFSFTQTDLGWVIRVDNIIRPAFINYLSLLFNKLYNFRLNYISNFQFHQN